MIAFLRLRWSLCLLVLGLGLQLGLAGCATVSTGAALDPRDPWEGYNRQVWRFNEIVDDAVLLPVARGYRAAVPELVRTGVSNFFGNISDVWSLVNNVLQLKPQESAQTLARVGINTSVGLLGVIDVASGVNLPRHREDFGQTLGHWGLASGPYLVLPLLGPSTLRDAAALPVDWKGDLVGTVDDGPSRGGLTGLRLVNLRSSVLDAGRFIDAAALDKYTFVRDAHLQRRRGTGDLPKVAPAPEERYDLPEPSAPAR
ncbi:MAG: VacJ family lipoprotein [Betaproteobacteria bacterium]